MKKQTKYNTDTAIIQHIFKDLLNKLLKKHKFTTEDRITIRNAQKIMLDKAKNYKGEK